MGCVILTKIGVNFMKEKHKYHIADIANIIIFYSVLICFIVFAIIGIIGVIDGTLQVYKLCFRLAFVILMFVPYVIKKIFRVTFSRVTTSVFYLFMFLSAFLGNVLEFYRRFYEWDMIIHFIMGVLLSVLSIYILNLTIYKKGSKHNLFFTFLFMIAFATCVGALWEIWEFSGDILFDLGSQRYVEYDGTLLVGKKALFDTMMDIIMDLSGAIVGVLFTAVMLKIDKRFLKSFTIKKLKNFEPEIEDIEE